MTNGPLTFGGQPAVSRDSVILLEPIEGTLSPNLGLTISFTDPNEAGVRFVDITIPDPLDSEIDSMKMISYGFVGNQRTSFGVSIPADTLTAMKADSGTFRLPGTAADYLGSLSGIDPVRVEVLVRNDEGWGAVRDTWSFTYDEPTPITPFALISLPEITGTATEGEIISYVPAVWTGEVGVVEEIVWKTAEDGTGTDTGTNETIIVNPENIVPEITAGQDVLFPGSFFSGPGIDAGNEGPHWGLGVDIQAAAVETPVTLDEDWLIPTNHLFIDGVSDQTFTPGATLTATGSKSATIVAYEQTTGELFLGPITNGPFLDNVAVSASSGGAATANGNSASWTFAGGESFYFLEPTFNGTPTSNVLIQHVRDNEDDVTPTVANLTGSFPPHFGSMQWRGTKRVSGYGIPTTEDFSSDWINIGIPELEALPTTDWIIVVTNEGSGVERVSEILVKDSLNTTACMWTTSTQAFIDANPFPTGFETTTYGTTTTVNSVVYRRYATADAIRGTPPKNYVLFDDTDAERRQRFGIKVQIGGAWSPLGTRQTVPDTYSPPSGDLSSFVRLTSRSQEQAATMVGGLGMQIARGYDSDGEYAIVGFDVTYPMITDNGGIDWYSDDCRGLNMHQTCQGIVIDGDYVHGMFGALYNQPVGEYADFEGIYRKSRSANEWTFRQALTPLHGSGKGSLRVQQRYIAKDMTTGTSHLDRTLYAIYAPAQADSTETGFSTIRIYKSTNGGDTWAPDGANITGGVATHGVPYQLWADNDILYMNTSTRVLRRTAGGTWNVATGLPAGRKMHFEKRGSTLYVAVEGQGLYTATDAATPAFTQFKAFNIMHFSVNPLDTDYIIITGKNNVVPQYTKTGGAPWTNIVTQPYDGQPNSFADKVWDNNVLIMWHTTDKERAIVQTKQYMSRTTNGGGIIFYSSNGFDYSRTNAIAFHPTDYLRFGCSMTDRMACIFENPAWFMEAGATKAEKDIIDGYLGVNPSAHAGSGMITLKNGNHTGYMVQIGGGGSGATSIKTPVIMVRGTTVTPSDNTTTGNGTGSFTASADLPGGKYILTATTAGATAVFNCRAPLGEDMGDVTTGAGATVLTHPTRGGTLTCTINDGSINFTAGAVPKTFTVEIDPAKSKTITNEAIKIGNPYGQTNPADPSQGISGRHKFSINASGVISRTGVIDYPFRGYMGSTGDVLLANSGNTTLMRSVNGGDSFTQWATGLTNFSPLGGAIVYASHHNDQRAFCGHNNGKATIVQNGTARNLFSFDNFVTLNSLTPTWPGAATVNGIPVPAVTGVIESWFDPNLVYVTCHLFGESLQFFRTKNALATSTNPVNGSSVPVWENITGETAPVAPDTIKGEGFSGPLYGGTASPHTDEVFLFSQHGTLIFRPEQSHLDTYNITDSIIDYLRSLPNGQNLNNQKV